MHTVKKNIHATLFWYWALLCQDISSTSQVRHIKMLIRQHDNWSDGHLAGHNKSLQNLQFNHAAQPQMSQVLRERAIDMLTAAMPSRAVACEVNAHVFTISCTVHLSGPTTAELMEPVCGSSLEPTWGGICSHCWLLVPLRGILLMDKSQFSLYRADGRRSHCCAINPRSSRCSVIMHGPGLQRSVHNSWRPKTSQFFQNTDI